MSTTAKLMTAEELLAMPKRDRLYEVDEKVQMWLGAGTRAVWGG